MYSKNLIGLRKHFVFLIYGKKFKVKSENQHKDLTDWFYSK